MRIAELTGELTHFRWDIILFSETRAVSAENELEGGHRLYTALTDVPSAGVGVLVHSKLKHGIVGRKAFSDRVLSLDIDIGETRYTFIAVYLPHAGYPQELLDRTYDLLREASDSAIRRGRTLIVGGDFNTQIDVGARGLQLAAYAAYVGLVIVNDEAGDDVWTFESSLRQRRRLDFILAPARIPVASSRATKCLDMGSDHRAVEAIFRVSRSPRTFRPGARSVRGWVPQSDAEYARELISSVGNVCPRSLEDLETAVVGAALKCQQSVPRERSRHETWSDPTFQALLTQRRSAAGVVARRELSKRIRKEARKRIRREKTRRTQHILSEFQDLGRLEDLRCLPARSRRVSMATDCSPDSCSAFLADIFKSGHGFSRVDMLLRECIASGTGGIPDFTPAELRRALDGSRNRKSPDPRGIVVEMFKRAPTPVLTCLLHLFNGILRSGSVERRWLDTLFVMLPKSGDRSLPENWRPIALLPITYKLFSRLLLQRLQGVLDAAQPEDQVGFRPGHTIEEAFAVFECVSGKSLEWRTPCWVASLDLRKAFDRIEYVSLFQALRAQGVGDAYIALLASIYRGQYGQVRDSSAVFGIERGVKQGDVISPALFNAGLELALSQWKARIANLGLDIGGAERLTNIRYADDLLIYAQSTSELASMVDSLCEELANVGLSLNTSKTRVFTTVDVEAPLQVDMGGGFVQVLTAGEFHRYLGKRIPGDLRNRWNCDINARIQSAWVAFSKYRGTLADRHVSLRSRMQLFATAVTPAALFGLKTCPCTPAMLEKLDVVQRRMLRLIVGWKRDPAGDWATAMRIMRDRVAFALRVYPIQNWSRQLAAMKYRFASAVARKPRTWAFRAIIWEPAATYTYARRLPGRPAVRWDDDLQSFSQLEFGKSWIDAVSFEAGWDAGEFKFVDYICP